MNDGKETTHPKRRAPGGGAPGAETSNNLNPQDQCHATLEEQML
jgi:hypothetical protein